MRKKFYTLSLLLIALIFMDRGLGFAATVGNPLDLDIPRRSAMLREQVIDETLDEYEQKLKIKAALDMEFVFTKDLNTPSEVNSAELKGQWYMVKLGTTFFNKVEPYIKLGSSSLEAKWRQNDLHDIEVEADYGFAWGGGVKGVIWEFEDWGVRLTGDMQCRITEPDVDSITLGGVGNESITDLGADFEVKEWQASIVLSKKFELPLRWQSIYIVPYTGISLSDSNVDVKFTNPDATPQDWTLFDANNKKIYGFLIGCDIMPSLTSTFIYSIEARLINEFALTLGGAVKF